ncbi:CapA family protein [Vibrio breoganii]|uniref:CapA family protein n=1 Tax=Vibrio breoganii TaxID=553239 RepID=UPI000C824072|nr:CapA family protein [Vibrio breoganii]PML85240.1 hypothetical protein BCT68_07870 [Vibrio breoganii]
MIYCGDFVFPFDNAEPLDLPNDFLSKEKIVNFESLIIDDFSKYPKVATGVALNSSPTSIVRLKQLSTIGVSLANNHIQDFDISINEQRSLFSNESIQPFGAGDNIDVASEGIKYTSNNVDFYALSFGWDVIKCPYATRKNRGVNPMVYEHIIELVERAKIEHSDRKIVVIFHANYEFELYPQPGHRKLYFELIDIGVDAVFCHHTHIVGGYEIYKGRPIFYSLGNFYLPDYEYSGFKLISPSFTNLGLCVEYNGIVDEILLHWVENKNNKLVYIGNENLHESKKMKALSEFSGMSHQDYINWFRVNRAKKKLLPIYKNPDSKVESYFNGELVNYRQKVIDLFVRLGLKKY